MKEIIKITIALTISCLIAGLVMGLVFTVTARAKKHNEYLNVQHIMFSLLGYSKTNPAPSGLKLYNIYRYNIKDGESMYLGYMIPVKKGRDTGYELLVIDLKGHFVSRHGIDILSEETWEENDRKTALKSVLRPSVTINYADTTIIAGLDGQRVAYLLPGKFPGFKTFIHAMLAIDANFRILGLEIIEHEEDPGLGGEIEQEYFKNQFKDKSFEKIKKLKVIKKPLPAKYRKYLEKKKWRKEHFSEADFVAIRKNYEDEDIYAITAATISTKAVTNGVRNMTKKFACRIKILDKVIAARKVPVLF